MYRRDLRSVSVGVLLAGAVCAVGACSDSRSPEAPSPPRPGPGAVQPSPATPGLGLLQIGHVDVLVMESFPPQILVKVDGTLPDGCTEVGDITQQRTDRTIVVTIPTRRTTDGACIAIAPQVSRNIRLNGSFAESGTYTVRVNGVEKTFTL